MTGPQILLGQEKFIMHYDSLLAEKMICDGDYIIAGIPHPPNSTIVLSKKDNKGNSLWSKKYFKDGLSGCRDMIRTEDSGFLILGHTYFDLQNSAFPARLDQNGDTIWTGAFTTGTGMHPNAVVRTGDGGFVITGSGTFNSGEPDIILLKTNSGGEVQW
jgi:hypothetical protein